MNLKKYLKNFLIKIFDFNFDKEIQSVLVSRIVSAIAYSMLAPFLAIILLQHNGLTNQDVAIIISIYSFSQTGLMIPAAFILNKCSHKNGIMIGRILSGVLCLGYIYINDFATLIGITILYGLGTSLYNLACTGYFSIKTEGKSKEKLQLFSFNNTALNLGSTLGPLLSSFLIKETQFKFLLYFIAILNIISAFVIENLNDFKNQEGKNGAKSIGFRAVFTNKSVYPALIVTCLLQIVFRLFFVVLPIYLVEKKTDFVSYPVMMSIYTIMIVFLQVPVVNVSNRFIGNNNYRGLGIVAIFLSSGLILFSLNGLGGFIATIIFTLGGLLFNPYSNKVVSDLIINSSETNAYFSIFNLIWSLAKGFSSYIGIILLGFFSGVKLWTILSFFGWTALIFCGLFYNLPYCKEEKIIESNFENRIKVSEAKSV